MHAPTANHGQAVKIILRFLKVTINDALVYRSGSFTLLVFSDADYVGDPDGRRSTGGYGVYLGPNLISWSS